LIDVGDSYNSSNVNRGHEIHQSTNVLSAVPYTVAVKAIRIV